MLLSDLEPLVFVKTPLSKLEQEQLSNELRRTGEDFLFKILALLGFILLIAVVPPRRGHRESLVSQYGFSKGILIAAICIGVPMIWYYYFRRRSYQRDLQEGLKTVQKTTIVRKERSFFHKKYFIWVDKKAPKQQKIEVESDVYDKLQKGQMVSLTFAPHSEYFLGIDYHLSDKESGVTT